MNKLLFSLISILMLFSLTAHSQSELNDTKVESSELETSIEYMDDVVERKIIREQKLLDFESIREADITWEKRIWRVIDTREKMNQVFVKYQRNLFSLIKDAAERGEIKTFSNELFTELLSNKNLEDKFYEIDTISVYNPETFIDSIQVVIHEIDPREIKTFRIKEVWFFDKEASRMQSRILGIAPIKIEIDESTGLEKYEAPLFWIYYPELRKVLAKEPVFNDRNDRAPGTWADIFDNRFFSSYIYKESNVQGYRLQDKFMGLENAGLMVLQESDKINNRLLDFEHDLWVY